MALVSEEGKEGRKEGVNAQAKRKGEGRKGGGGPGHWTGLPLPLPMGMGMGMGSVGPSGLVVFLGGVHGGSVFRSLVGTSGDNVCQIHVLY